MFVRTERLFLRPCWPEDLDDLLEALDDEEDPRGTVANLPRSAGELREFLTRPRDPRLPKFVMYRRSAQGPEFVGGIGFGLKSGEVELGYWIAPRFRGRGYAAEAVRAALRQARALGHSKVYANYFDDCGASVEVLESAGFRDTGRVNSQNSVGRRTEAKGRVYVADLERRANFRSEAASGPQPMHA